MAHKAKKKQRIGRPNPFLYLLALLILRPYYRLRYGVRVDNSAVRGLRGPAIILAPHISNKDHILVGMALWPRRVTFVLSQHFLTFPILGWFLRRMHAIGKRMFSADTRTIMQILRAKAEGNIIALFPEGRLPACGHSLPLADGTGALIQKLGLPVYTVTGNGAYLTFPKWGKYRRRGKIVVSTAQLFTAEELAAMTPEAVDERMRRALAHDDEAAMAGVRYRVKDTTAGLDGILRWCPVCGAWGTLMTRRGHIRCSACTLDATLDETYRLHGAPFDTVNAWFDRQQANIDLDKPLTAEVTVEAINRHGHLDRHAGRGVVTLDREAFAFSGEVFGERADFSLTTKELGGIPVTVAKHIDVYHNNRLLRLYPVQEPRDAILFTCYLDKLHGVTPPMLGDGKETSHVEQAGD